MIYHEWRKHRPCHTSLSLPGQHIKILNVKKWNANYEEAGGKNVIVNVKRLKYDFTECMPFNAVKNCGHQRAILEVLLLSGLFLCRDARTKRADHTLQTITHGSHNSQDLIFNARQLKNRWKHDLGPTWIMLIGGYKELKWWNVSQVEEAFDMTRVVNLGR